MNITERADQSDKRRPVPKERQFVETNANEVAITEILQISTELNGTETELDYWEIKPILSMDNFAKLNLKNLQGQKEKIGIIREESVKRMFVKKLNQTYGVLLPLRL